MVRDYCAGALFRVPHERLTELDADAFRLEQDRHLRLFFEVRTRRVAKRVTGALIVRREDPAVVRCILACDPEFLADALVPELGESFRAFHREAVPVQVIGINVRFEELTRELACAVTHRDEGHSDDVVLRAAGGRFLDAAEEIGDALP
jgi:hypothetical protein